MNEDTFFRGFIAALREYGLSFVETRSDDQHRRFGEVVHRIDAMIANREPGSERLPRLFVPSPVTNRFPELDEALLEAQRGRTGAKNPYYPGAELVLTPEYARNELEEFTPEERMVFAELADIYASQEARVRG